MRQDASESLMRQRFDPKITTYLLLLVSFLVDCLAILDRGFAESRGASQILIACTGVGGPHGDHVDLKENGKMAKVNEVTRPI